MRDDVIFQIGELLHGYFAGRLGIFRLERPDITTLRILDPALNFGNLLHQRSSGSRAQRIRQRDCQFVFGNSVKREDDFIVAARVS